MVFYPVRKQFIKLTKSPTSTKHQYNFNPIVKQLCKQDPKQFSKDCDEKFKEV